MTQDVSFSKPAAAAGGESGLLATATGARVDVWRLQHNEVKEGEDDDFGPEELAPIHTLRRFTEVVTALKLREDGSVFLAGDKLGKIELVELS